MPDLSPAAASRFLIGAGLVLDEVSGTRVRGHLELGPDHHTPWGVVHGGVYTTAVESAASVGATAAVVDRGQYSVGLHNATDFLRAATEGRAEVLAEPLQQGRTQQLWLVTVTNARGKELARGQLRVAEPPTGRRPLVPGRGSAEADLVNVGVQVGGPRSRRPDSFRLTMVCCGNHQIPARSPPLLAFARSHPRRCHCALTRSALGLSATAYYQRLMVLLDRVEAAVVAPDLVEGLRAGRDRRRASRRRAG